MEKAILKAIEGGWDETGYAYGSDMPPWEGECTIGAWRYDVKVFLDPLFWQALLKAPEFGRSVYKNREWFNVWISFIDALAQGKSPDEFFDNLLKK